MCPERKPKCSEVRPRGERGTRRAVIFACRMLAFTTALPFHGRARAEAGQSTGGAGVGFGARASERRKEGLFFSDYLGAKSESARLDLLYRFYTSESRRPRPRVEPFVYGLGCSVHALDSARALSAAPPGAGSSGGARDAKRSYTGSGYGGELFLNNFVSGTTGLPTLNIVPGIRGSHVEDKANPDNKVTTAWGPTVRLFGANQQDTALFLSYRALRRSVRGEAFSEWAWQGGGRLYLLPALAIESEALFNEDFLHGEPSPLFSHRGFHAGGFLELSIVRVGYRFERDEFHARPEAARDSSTGGIAGSVRRSPSLGGRVREERQSLFVGVSY